MAVVAIVVFSFVGCARHGTERATQVEYGGASAGKIAHNIVQQSCFNVGVFGSGGHANNNSIMRDTHLLFQPPVILAENVRYPPPSQTTSACWPPVSTPTSCTSRTSFDEFIAMKNEIINDHGDMHVNFKKSGSHDEMFSFCKGEWSTFSVPMCLVAGRRGNDPPPLFLWFTS